MGGQYYNGKEMGVNTRSWVDSTEDKDHWRAPCECGIKIMGSMSLGVINLFSNTYIFESRVLNTNEEF